MNQTLLAELEAALRTTLEDDEDGNGRLERGTVGRVKRALEKVRAAMKEAA